MGLPAQEAVEIRVFANSTLFKETEPNTGKQLGFRRKIIILLVLWILEEVTRSRPKEKTFTIVTYSFS